MSESRTSSFSLRGQAPRNVYRRQPIDPSVPPLSASQLLSIPPKRPRRKLQERPLDPFPDKFYGDAVIQKAPNSLRFFFHNVKGLSSTSGNEDYRYYLSCLKALAVDVSGLSETNTCWSHPHLACDFRSVVRRHFQQSKVVFGSPSTAIDSVPLRETFQSGGNLTLVTGDLVSRVQGKDTHDPSGLGRWNGLTIRGPQDQLLTIITAYRVCSDSPTKASMGSAFLCEHDYLRDSNHGSRNPRRVFLTDLQLQILQLLEQGHEILLMLDANATIADDQHFAEFVNSCALFDLHETDPAQSTYIGAPSRRIDYLLGTHGIKQQLVRSGTLSYFEGPQSDHRGLYIDIHRDFFNLPNSVIPPAKTRTLHTGNSELVEKYHSSMLRYYEEHRMVTRIEELAANYRTMTREEVRWSLEKWDKDQGRAMQSSEKALSHPPKKYQWSPVLRNSAIVRLYWKLRLREVLHKCDYHSTFLRWQRQIQVQDSSFSLPMIGQSLTADQIRREFNIANRHFRSCQKASIPLRMKTYQDLLEHYEGDVNPLTSGDSRRKARIVQRTIDTEVVRSQFQGLRRVLKPSHSTGISKILVPRKGDGPTEADDTYNLLQNTHPDDLVWETIVE